MPSKPHATATRSPAHPLRWVAGLARLLRGPDRSDRSVLLLDALLLATVLAVGVAFSLILMLIEWQP